MFADSDVNLPFSAMFSFGIVSKTKTWIVKCILLIINDTVAKELVGESNEEIYHPNSNLRFPNNNHYREIRLSWV